MSRRFLDRIPLPRCLSLALLRWGNRRLCRSQEPYLASRFRPGVGYQPDLALPRRYHEKMMWRKLFDHNPLFVTFCDKLACKEYVAARLPQVRVPETLWVGSTAADIPPHLLRQRVVFKCNHGCGYNFFWEPGLSDFQELDRLTRQWLVSDHGRGDLEWGYAEVAPRVIFAEPFIGSEGSVRPIDLGVRCADGKAILVHVITNNKTHEKQIGYFHPDGQRALQDMDFQGSHWTTRALPSDFVLPSVFHQAIEASRDLSVGVDYSRYDFLTDGQTLFAGEITVYPAAGISKADFKDGSLDDLINRNWDVRKSWFLTSPQRGRRRLYAHVLNSALQNAA